MMLAYRDGLQGCSVHCAMALKNSWDENKAWKVRRQDATNFCDTNMQISKCVLLLMNDEEAVTLCRCQ